jgi:predicted nucleic acid-binding protein
VKFFLDTSVLVAATRTLDQRHPASYNLVARCEPQHAYCAAHTLAEVYANLTGMPPPHRFLPAQALLILEDIRSKFDCIALTAEEVFNTTRQAAKLKLPGGIIYDALLLTCVRKVGADRIYTWNVRHFQMIAPDLAERIVRP